METTMRPVAHSKKVPTRIYQKKESGLSKQEVLAEFNEALEELKLVREGHDTYWLNEPLRHGFTQAHNIYIDGGDQTFLSI